MNHNLHQVVQNILSKISEDINIDLKNFELCNFENVLNIVKSEIKNLDNKKQERIISEFDGKGPLKVLLISNEVTEILINGYSEIWYEKNGLLYKHDDSFFSEITFQNFLERLQTEAKIEVSKNSPFADGTWLEHRVHLIIPPAATTQYLSIRKKKESSWTLKLLQEANWASNAEIELLRKIVLQKKNFLIVGGTSSGKTSVLNACLQELSSNERVVIIEDTKELFLPNEVSTSLTTRSDAQRVLTEILQEDLLKQALRMRPDRICMGEVRGKEAKDLLMSFATGHEGSFGSLHANSAHEALIRLEMLIQIGAPQWAITAIRKLIQLSLDYIIVVKKSEGKRKLDGIYRISSLEDFGFLTEKESLGCNLF